MSSGHATNSLAAGLQDAVHESQQAFRQVLDALARPGQIRQIGVALPGVELGGAMARLLLSLTDDETPVHWQVASQGKARDSTLHSWLQFHTGARATMQAEAASFAVVTEPSRGLALVDYAQGSAASPEFSCTLLMELPSLNGGTTLEWHGPGIQHTQVVGLEGLPENFWAQWQANHASFPQGVDIIFTCGEYALALPRTTRVRRLEGI